MMNKETTKYRLSFTTGGLFLNESPIFIDEFLAGKQWEALRSDMIERDQLHLRTRAASVRVTREIVARLKQLTVEEMQFFSDASVNEQRWLLWVAVCRRYKLIREFATEVLRERYLTLEYHVDLQDFDAFFFRKGQIHDEVEDLKESTRRKLRQNLFRILREADMVSEQNVITPPALTPSFVALLAQSNPNDLQVFPASQADLERWSA